MAKRRARRGPTTIQRSRGISSEDKALYHNEVGAGKAHVIRKFFELNDQDMDALRDTLARLVNARLGR